MNDSASLWVADLSKAGICRLILNIILVMCMKQKENPWNVKHRIFCCITLWPIPAVLSKHVGASTIVCTVLRPSGKRTRYNLLKQLMHLRTTVSRTGFWAGVNCAKPMAEKNILRNNTNNNLHLVQTETSIRLLFNIQLTLFILNPTK